MTEVRFKPAPPAADEHGVQLVAGSGGAEYAGAGKSCAAASAPAPSEARFKNQRR